MTEPNSQQPDDSAALVPAAPSAPPATAAPPAASSPQTAGQGSSVSQGQSQASAPGVGQRLHDFSAHVPNVGEALAQLASYIPGFSGYKSAEDRRIADKQLRATIGERLSALKARLDAVTDTLSRSGDLTQLAAIDRTASRLERLIDRMRFADYGYAAVFDRVQMGDAELGRLYAHDAEIMRDLGAFDAAAGDIERNANDAGGLKSALDRFDSLAAEFDRRFEAREHLFDGITASS